MQFTEINKLVRLFLLGSCAALLLGLYFPDMLSRLPAAVLDKESFAIPLGLVFLGFVTALGCLVEGFAQSLIGKVCQASLRRPWIAWILWRKSEITRVNDWRDDFEKASRATKRFPIDSAALARQKRSLAGGLLHKSGPPEHVKYADAHYGIFVLSSGLAVILPFFFYPFKYLLEPKGQLVSFLAPFVVCLLGVYFLCSLALLNYFYVWEASHRFSCIMLWEEAKAAQGEQSHNPAAPADRKASLSGR